MRELRIPELIAHRGNAAEYPENTLPSLRSALELGVEFVQFDVQLSNDRVPVLLCDESLARTAGLERSVLEMTAGELAEVAVNETTRLHGKFTDVGIPTLAHAVSLLQTHPRATAFIELQRASLAQFGAELVVRKVCEILRPIARQCVVVASDLAAVHLVRELFSYRMGWVIAEYSSLSALKCEALAPDYLFCDYAVLPPSREKLWRGPWRWAITRADTRAIALEAAGREARLIATTQLRLMLRELRALQKRAES